MSCSFNKLLMSSLFSLFILSLTLSIAQAQVPENATFKFVNEGELGPYIVEYDGSYRMLSVFNSPFQLAFYNTTPNAFTLALRMGLRRSEFRWVWEANRGNPVGENATLTFGTDGNLVLADADGRVAWQTNTANKGVVGFQLLPNGNIVLHDSKGNFIWQSFDYPTDTLLVGQTLRNKLVSRLSAERNKDGPYSFVIEPKGFSLYYQGKNSNKPLKYFSLAERFSPVQGTLKNVTLQASPETDEGYAYDVKLELSTGGSYYVGRPKYNGTSSLLRLGIDGNVKVYTYNDKVDTQAWEVVFSIFDRESFWETECQLPSRCGNFGVCEDNQCVACPSEKGLLGWSKNCAPPKITSCRPSDFHYYKIDGVDHFLSKYTSGSSVKETDCEKKCTSDCKCLGYFYNTETSRCWVANELKTLTKVANSTHVGYIKTPN
ncbi:Epidermis-specific secreted glycoprotein EP1 [Morus notabilis]|uniref:Epidermis-specific secreted glycoprotein EP1 n=1 Tax=Morus notabilis TaxID=981085 RepID=W9S9U6_9ROSA|nr:epidermis-specific secreted glycoprotein EP1 [Morus notabilis]EXC18477.1 Epidermis-specific secreted glycoprotein EP1 [Morus notabilis]